MFDVKDKSISWVSFFFPNVLFALLKKRKSSIYTAGSPVFSLFYHAQIYYHGLVKRHHSPNNTL